MESKLRFTLISLLMMLCGTAFADYVKVTQTSDITDGDYLIVYETGNVAFDGALTTLDAVSNTVAVEISDGKIASSTAIDAAVFTIDVTNGTLQSASGKYIGVSSNSNGLKTEDVASTYKNSFAIDEGENAVITAVFDGSTTTLRYNKASNQARFRYYKSGQEAIQLYKKTSGETPPAETVAKPVITPNGGTFFDQTEATITCETEGATIYYTMNGETPNSTNSPMYGRALPINETLTLKAIAVKGEAVSAVASATFTKIESYSTIAALNALENNTPFNFTGQALVVAKPTAKYVYIHDNSGNSLIYDKNSVGTEAAEVGKYITANWTGKVSIYNKLFELVPDQAIAVNADPAQPVFYPEGTFSDEAVNSVITLKKVDSYSVSGKNITIHLQGDDKNIDEAYGAAGYNQFGLEIAAAEEGKLYDIVGAVGKYNDQLQFWPIEIKEHVEEVPEPELSFYIVGNMTNWEIDANYKMTLNEALVEKGIKEFSVTMTLAAGAEFKAVSSTDGTTIKTYFPEGMENNYVISEAGDYTIYFRPNADGGDDWHYKVICAVKEEVSEPITTTYTASFTTNSGWENVYAYTWTDGESVVQQLGGWPGTKLEKDAATGLYNVTIESEEAPAYIIFNNGVDEQTADLVFENGKAYAYNVDGPAEPIYIETDLTSQFSALTDWTKWTGATGYTATNFCPKVTTNAGQEVQVCEKYEMTCANTGDVFYQTVTGLTPGTYKIELYGGAAFTFGRGFGSMAFTGDLSVASSETYQAGDKIEPTQENPTGVTLSATTSEGVYGGEIPIYYATNFPDGAATVVLDGVVVGENGEVKIGMSKTSQSTNWHVVQLKGVTAQVDAVELHAKELAAAQAALNAEENAIVTGEEKTALETAISENATVAEQTADAYKAAIKALSDATTAFTGAKAAYQALADAQAYLVDLPYADAAKKPVAEAATNAADATAKAEALLVALRAYYESAALAENVAGAKVMTDSIKNPKAEDGINNWTVVKGEGSGGSINVLEGEPWTDAAGVAEHKYFDGGNWGAQAWDVALEQKIALPAGKYLLTTIGRAEKAVDFTLYAGADSVKIPAISSVGGVFNRGWNNASVEFEMAEADSIVIGVRGVTSEVHNWMSFSDFRLVQLEKYVSPLFYVVGSMNEWTPSENYKMAKNEEAAAGIKEYVLTTPLETGTEFKVVSSYDSTTVATWFPAEGENYVVNEAGEYTIYFRPNYDGDGWFYNALYAEKKNNDPEFNTYTATFTTNADWEKVYAYAWTTSEAGSVKEYLGEWPGMELESVDSVYTVTIEATEAPAYIIYNNGEGEQTADLAFENNKAYEFVVEVVDLMAEAKTLAADEEAVAVGKLLAAIEEAATSGDESNLGAAIKQFKADNAESAIDMTDKVGTSLESWTAGTGNRGNKGTYGNLVEHFGDTSVGVMLSQEVEVENGFYNIGLYATSHNAWNGNYASYTDSNGDNPAPTLQEDANDVAYVFGTSGENTVKTWITARRNSGMLDIEPELYDINGLEVTDGKLTMGLALAKAGQTEWHTIQIGYLKKITTAKMAYAALKVKMQETIAAASALMTEYRTEGIEVMNAAIETAEATLTSNMLNIPELEFEIAKLNAAIESFKIVNRTPIDGIYYVQNVATGKYMAAGHNWGVFGIVNETGLDLTLNSNEDNTVDFDSQVSNGGNSHYLGGNLYMDSQSFGWSVEKAGDDVFTISNGTQFIGIDDDDNLVMQDEAVEWKFITPAERMATLSTATAEAGVDATFLIKGADFNRNDLRNAYWAVSEDCTQYLMGGIGINLSNYYTDVDHSTFTISQNVQEVPAGVYALTVQGFYQQYDGVVEDVPTFFVNNVTANVPVKTSDETTYEAISKSFAEGNYTTKPLWFEVDENGEMTVGIQGTGYSQWVCFDNFRLTYYGADATIPEPEVLLGDVNGNGEVTTTDAVMAVYFALEKGEPTTAQFKAADVDGSNTITVSDAVGIVNIALEIVFDEDSLAAGARMNVDMSNNYLTLNEKALSLTNTMSFVGFQMDVTLAEGAQFNGVQRTERTANMLVDYNRVGENTWRIIGVSLQNSVISGSEGDLLTLDITGNNTVDVTNIEFTDAAARACQLFFVNETTGISEMNDSHIMNIYNVNGVRNNTMKKGMNIIRNQNGEVKKVFVK